MLENGDHSKVVQSRLGHSSTQMTMDLPATSAPGLDREAAERLGTVIDGLG